VKRIGLIEVEKLAFYLAQKGLCFDEPIPDFTSRYPNILESCVAAPFQYFGGRPLYMGLVSTASMLFYFMSKNHPFLNGNKRIAITTLLVFLQLNGKWINIDIKKFYDFSVYVAASPPSEMRTVVKNIKNFIRTYMVNYY
jgi:death-on-curing protein